MFSITAIDHVSLSVRDLEASIRWYDQALGLAVIRRVQGPEFGRAIVGSGPGRPVFGLTQHWANPGQPFSERAAGLDHLAFAVASEELEAWKHRLEGLGLAWRSPREGLLVLRDPDNIQIELSGP